MYIQAKLVIFCSLVTPLVDCHSLQHSLTIILEDFGVHEDDPYNTVVFGSLMFFPPEIF